MSQSTQPPTIPTTVHWSQLYAFGLPAGSVRAILAIAVLGTSAALTALNPGKAIPDAFRDLAFLILGHYFALRRTAVEPEQIGPGPLFLPRGTIRVLIMAGYVAVIAILLQRRQPFNPTETPGVYTLIIITGFLLGTSLSLIARWLWNRGRRPKRIWIDLRAAFVLLATVALVLIAWNESYVRFLPELRPDSPQFPITAEGFRHLLAAFVAFYFGARS